MDASRHAHLLCTPIEDLARAFKWRLTAKGRRGLTGHEEILAGLAFLMSCPRAKDVIISGRAGYDGIPEIAVKNVPHLSMNHTRMLHDSGWTLVDTTEDGNVWTHPEVGVEPA